MFLWLLFFTSNIAAFDNNAALNYHFDANHGLRFVFPDQNVDWSVRDTIRIHRSEFPNIDIENTTIGLDNLFVRSVVESALDAIPMDSDLCREPVDPADVRKIYDILCIQKQANSGFDLTEDQQSLLDEYYRRSDLQELGRVFGLRGKFLDDVFGPFGCSLKGMPSVERDKTEDISQMTSIEAKLDDYEAKGFSANCPGWKLYEGAKKQHEILAKKLEEKQKQREKQAAKEAQQSIEQEIALRGIATSESASIVGTPKGSTPKNNTPGTPSLKRPREEDSGNPLLQQHPSKKPTKRALFSTSCRDEEDGVGLPKEDDYDSDDLEKCEKAWSLLPPLPELN